MNRLFKNLMVFCIATCLILSMTVFAVAEHEALVISGIGEDVVLTETDLAALEQVDIECTSVDSQGEVEQVSAVGVSLKSIVAEADIEWSNITSANLIASDGYIMSAAAPEFTDTDIYILSSMNGEKLDAPRSCIPDKRSMYWVRGLVKVELSIDDNTVNSNFSSSEINDTDYKSDMVSSISFFSENIKSMEPVVTNLDGIDVNAYSIKEYYDKYFQTVPGEPVLMIASDGFSKTEMPEIFLSCVITNEDEDAPLYFSEDVKRGMYVKQLLYVINGSEALYTGSEITVPELFTAVGMVQSDNYVFVASDGYEVIIPKDAIEYGKIFVDDEKGDLRVYFDGYDFGSTDGKGKVKYLSLVAAVDESYSLDNNTETKNTNDAEAKEESPVLIKCFIGDNKIMLTEADFANLPQVTKSISRTNSKGETIDGEYTGVEWKDIAEFIGVDPETEITAVCADGYEAQVPADVLCDEGSMFATLKDGELISGDEEGRLWFCGSENFTANFWVKYITKIVVE